MLHQILHSFQFMSTFLQYVSLKQFKTYAGDLILIFSNMGIVFSLVGQINAQDQLLATAIFMMWSL